MDGSSWILAVSVVIIALALVVLVVFFIMNFFALHHTLKDLEKKLHSFDPLLRLLSHFGECIEKKSGYSCREECEHVCKKCMCKECMSKEHICSDVCREAGCCKRDRRDTVTNTAVDVADWVVLGLSLWQRILKRRS